MNTTMSEYRAKLKTDNILLAVGVAALAAVQVLAFTGIITPAVPGERFASFWNGFMAGAAMGITALLLVGLIRNLLAMKSEDKLRRLYAKDNDERTCQIHEKGQAAGLRICLLLMLPACVIAGYFSVTVFLTCITVVAVQAVITGLCKLYYRSKL